MISILRRLAWMPPFLIITASFAQAQEPRRNWELGARLLATGSSHESEPSGYTVYSAVPLEVLGRRHVNDRFSVELAARMEAREIDQLTTPTNLRLGSIDFLAFNLLAQYRFGRGRWTPYVAAGGNATVAWEKTGALDSMDVSPSFGPAIGAGLNIAMNSYLYLNVDLRWNTASHDVTSHGTQQLRLTIDPAALGVAFTVRF